MGFRLEYALWGPNASGYHWVNILLHAASAVLLWRVLRNLALPGAWLAAAVFALHPVNVESVAWISQRKNTLCMFFYLLSALCFLKSQDEAQDRARSHLFYGLSLLIFICALLSKTAVVFTPLVLLALIWWKRQRLTPTDVWRSIPFLTVAFVLGLVTVWFERLKTSTPGVLREDSFSSQLAGAGWAVWFYLGKALLPWPLSFVYPRWTIDARAPLSYLPTVAVVLSAMVLWHYRRTWGRAGLIGLGYFVVMLFPVLGLLNVGFMGYSLVADHWQYFAIIAPVALAAAAASSTLNVRSLAFKRLGCVVVLLGLGLLTWRQSARYGNAETLWRAALAAYPSAWLGHVELGVALQARGHLDEALAEYNAALQAQPRFARALSNRALILAAKGRHDEAIAQFREALNNDPRNPTIHYLLAGELDQQHRPQEAIPHYQAALRANPQFAACNDLGTALTAHGKFSEAAEAFLRAIQLDPSFAEAHDNLGVVLQSQGKPVAAEAEFRTALRLQPDMVWSRNNLGLALQAQGRTAEAIAEFRRVLKVHPDHPETHNNLGKTLFEQGKVTEAMAEFAEAVRLRPGYADAQYNLGNALLVQGKPAEAIPPYLAAVRARPDYAEAHYQLGVILAARQRPGEAIPHLREAVQLRPDWLEPLNNLAWLLATQLDASLRNGPEAVRFAARAVELTRTNNPGALDTLAAAYAEVGRFREAADTAQKAVELALAVNQKQLAAEIQQRREAYAANRPFRE